MKLLPLPAFTRLFGGSTAALIFAGLFWAPVANASTVVIGEADATNIRVSADVSGQVDLLEIIPVTVGGAAQLALNDTSMSSPLPGSISANSLSESETVGLELDADAGTDANAVGVTSFSDVDGNPGPRLTDGDAFLTEANVSVGLSGVVSPVIELGLTSLPANTIQATSTITGDGVIGMTALAESNLLTSASALSLSILGFNIPDVTLTALSNGGGQLLLAGTILEVDPTLLADGILIAGTISIIADQIFENPPNPGTDDFYAFAQAIGLQVDIDVNAQITELDATELLTLVNTDLDIVSSIVINETSALMITPEPGKGVLLALGLLGLVIRRRRR